jgi:hypothetical protein
VLDTVHMLNIDYFHLEDPAPDRSLEDILPISTRAWALLARQKQNPLLKTHFWNLYGVADMIDGTQHHYDGFETIVKQLARDPSGKALYQNSTGRNLRHEVVAYLNRVGQLYYFNRTR